MTEATEHVRKWLAAGMVDGWGRGGMVSSTVLTLVIAPCLFVIVRSGADRLSSTLFGHQRSGASAPAENH